MLPSPGRILACAALFGAVALSVDASAQVQSRAASPRRARGRSIRCARGWKRNWRPSTAAAAAATRPRKSRSAATRMRPPSSRRARPRHLAGQAHGLRQFRLLLAVLRPVGAMRPGQQPDPADARQSGSDHHQPGAAAQRRPRRRRPRKPAPLGADGARAEQLRPAIRQRRARPRQFPGQSVRQQQQQSRRAARRRSRAAIRHLPHGLRPHLRRRLFPGLVRDRTRRASRTTRRPARRCARRRKRRCTPIAIPAKT